MAIFDKVVNLYDDISVGDYYSPSETNLKYDDLINNDIIQVINKYRELFKEEIKQGRGELDTDDLAKVTLEERDIEVLKPLINFNDSYTNFQINRINNLRKKLHIKELINLSKSLSIKDKAKLILQGILGYTRGEFIKNNEVNNQGKKLLTGHGYNISTDEVMKDNGFYYNENYYGSYNNPLVSIKTKGLTADFVSNVFFKTIMGERKAYEKLGTNDESRIRE
ncbi:UNVERIFIED_CONTAM: hypothetical protein O8I53_11695 [Campylobacter lari]